MPDPKVPYPFSPSPERPALSYGVLEPGLQAAIDLLEREAQNEKVAGELAEGRDAISEAMEHAHHFQAYRTAIDLLVEQRARLQGGLVKGEIQKWWAGHPGEAG